MDSRGCRADHGAHGLESWLGGKSQAASQLNQNSTGDVPFLSGTGNLSTEAGTRLRRSALGGYWRRQDRKIRPGIARFFARMRGMCGSENLSTDAGEQHFDRRKGVRSALGARHHRYA